MAKSAFEEKQYEGPMNMQLLAGSYRFFAPGQVLEATVGLDAAMWTDNKVFWAVWSGAAGGPPLAGAVPRPAWWSGATLSAAQLPPFALNLLVQYKRADRMLRPNAREWPVWKQKYYRYQVDDPPGQLPALSVCATALGAQGLVLYAAPAFHTLPDLWKHVQAGELVQHSNFVEATKLVGHRRWTFPQAGKFGIAHREPVEVASFQFTDEIGLRRERARGGTGSVFDAAARAAYAAASKVRFPRVTTETLRRLQHEVVEGVLERGRGEDASRESAAECGNFAVAAAFFRSAGIEWMIG